MFKRDWIVHRSVARIEICDASKLDSVAARHPGSNGQGTSPSTKKKKLRCAMLFCLLCGASLFSKDGEHHKTRNSG